ncbi:hypothetical protein FACS189456_7410 [Bacteroidia bacterium]|nr:hypothetical protein FACS189456_7410 [Bacteroidia bacterium]
MGCGLIKKTAQQQEKKIVVAYVTSWSSVIPDPQYVTHINYAFGHVNKTFDGIRIDKEKRLQKICQLKEQSPALKVLLSIGGWGSGGFSEMARDSALRRSFAADCRRVITQFNLDGVDIDWEYPTRPVAKIAASPDDTKHYTLLMQDIRAAIGKDKLLTLASLASAKYIDFQSISGYVDYVCIMSYDMGGAAKHHSALFRSDKAGGITAAEAVNAHLKAGMPRNKLVMGMPFYGRGNGDLPRFLDYSKIEQLDGYHQAWDDVAKVPYLSNADNVFVFGYENPQSIAIKCQYIVEQGLLGGMYWEYAGDSAEGILRKTMYNNLRP